MSDVVLYNAISASNVNLRSALGEKIGQAALCDPSYYTTWTCFIPTLCTTNAVCVYDNTTAFRAGGCCLWTIPAATTKVRFEIWGAGAGAGAPYCCGGSPFGATGAYASVILCNAVVGCAYTLCAGAAAACLLCCGLNYDVSGSPSYVTGHQLTNFCAMGGCSSLYTMMCTLHGTTCCRYQAYGSTTAGGCLCCDGTNQNHYCWQSCSLSCNASCLCITRFFQPNRATYGSSTTGTIYSIPSMYGADCIDTNDYSYMCDQPTILPGTCGCNTVSSICCVAQNSGVNCCGISYGGACGGFRCNPGKGGAPSRAYAGAVSVIGDLGRTGMVRVTWC